jgi:hypothetical protein
MLTSRSRYDVQLLSARDALSRVDTTAFVDLANRLLEEGEYDDALVAIIDCQPPVRSDVFPHFQDFCERNGIRAENVETAVWILLRYHLTRMADENIQAYDEFISFLQAMDDCYTYFRERKRFQIGDSHDIADLFHLEMQYSYHANEPESQTTNRAVAIARLDRLESEMRDIARVWLQRHPTDISLLNSIAMPATQILDPLLPD